MIIRRRDLTVDEPRYGFIHNQSFILLTMDQVSDFLGRGEELIPVGLSRSVWGTDVLLPENR